MATIWDDPDVRDIIQRTGGEPNLLVDDLKGTPQAMILRFIELDQQVTSSSPPTHTLAACLEGVRVVERFPDDLAGSNPRGWKKFVVYVTAANTQTLWKHHNDPHAGAVGAWVLEAMTRLGVEPDGFATALGAAYSSTMSVNGAAVVQDSISGRFVVRGATRRERLPASERGSGRHGAGRRLSGRQKRVGPVSMSSQPAGTFVGNGC